ncbi:lipid A biosynthesis lauroyl acyltransferase [Pseudoteredinibacter isoporae]|uniref:LpxL/LpxP family acyltransferase n=1 Tax=Pseudoteredinibacter isoporae TaxID=570281 RepID=UPI00310840C0
MSRRHENLDQFRGYYLHPKFWPLWLWFALLWLVGRLPLAAIRALGTGTGLLVYNVAKSRRRITLRNLELCFPEKTEQEREQIAKDSFAGGGMALWESGLIWFGSLSRIRRLHKVIGIEHLEREPGQAILLLGMHNACLEMTYGPLALMHNMKILFRVHNNPFWEYVAQKGRNRYNLTLISNKRVSQFVQHLNDGETGLIAADHDLGRKNSIFAPFFGIPTATVTTPSTLARASNAKVVFSCGYRTKDGYVIKLKPIDNFPSDNVEADIVRFNALVEAHVREHPTEYIWMHRRFKTRPEGEACLYKKK